MQVNLDKWHHCNVDKQEFVKLLQKSDYQGYKHMFIFFGSLVFFGYLAYATWGTWWTVLFLFIYGNIWNCADPIWHETGHKTAFKSNFWKKTKLGFADSGTAIFFYYVCYIIRIYSYSFRFP